MCVNAPRGMGSALSVFLLSLLLIRNLRALLSLSGQGSDGGQRYALLR